MLADAGSIVLGILVAVIGFAVVVLVCVIVLRLLTVVLPRRDESDSAEPSEAEEVSEPAEDEPTA